MLYYLLCLIHFSICIALVFFILLQANKGLGLSGAFGSFGGSDSVFSTSGSMNILVKITIGLAVTFALTSILLTIVLPPSGAHSIMATQDEQQTGQSVQDLVKQSQATKENAAVPAPGAGAAGTASEKADAGSSPQTSDPQPQAPASNNSQIPAAQGQPAQQGGQP
ncbi:MAG: preprotein translocase subunit SecG [Candidatus Omnitrophota bacterium]